MPLQFFNQLTESSTIITANRRLSRYLQEEHARYQQKLNKNAWTTPDIIPFHHWLIRCWQQCLDVGYGEPLSLLNEHQEQWLWETIIRQSPFGDSLLRLSDTARSAKQAWQLAQAWLIPIDSEQFQQVEDTIAFQTWAKQYRLLCQKNAWIDSTAIISKLSIAMQNQAISLPKKLFLAGFTEITPQQQQLLDTLHHSGCVYSLLTHPKQTPVAQRIGLTNTETELMTMARWAKQLLLTEKNPTHYIGCIIPNLTEIRHEVERIFTTVFDATHPFSNQENSTHLPFNLSAGMTFAQFPFTHVAFLILELGQDEVSLATLSSLLRSSLLDQYEQEMTKRAKLDVFLRSHSVNTMALRNVLSHAQHFCPLLAKKLQTLHLISQTIPKKQRPSEWRNHFMRLLNTLGWPGERQLNSTDFQLLDRWQILLEELASLDAVATSLSFNSALATLQQLAKNTLFQPKTPTTPIQILGALEAIGIQFKHLWIMGLHDGAWPTHPTPHPFLPYHLQRQYQIPRATAERELHFYHQLTETLCHNTEHIIFSYPQQEHDRTLQASALIKEVPEINEKNLLLADYFPYDQILFSSQKLVSFVDDKAPSLLPIESIRGGTQLFKLQAACPFRAFATLRLGIKELEAPQAGLTASERGSTIHFALEQIWNALKTQQKLREISASLLQDTIENAIDNALRKLQKNLRKISKRFLYLEKIRLKNLITQWLEIEKNRLSFAILETEKEITVQLKKISIHLRADRIDQLPDGSCVIIDYKTSEPSTNDWLGERPDDPQLPIYCVNNNLPIEGIVFAQIRANKMRFKGLVKTEKGIPKTTVIPNWNEQITTWKTVLEKLEQQFCDGFAAADPKKSSQTCQTCQLKTLCRIHEKMVTT